MFESFSQAASQRSNQSIVTPTSRAAHAVLRGLFRRFNERDITYVVPRKYEYLPSGMVGDDVDIYVAPEDFQVAIDTCRRVGFTGESSPIGTTRRLRTIATYAARNPTMATHELIVSPRKVLGLLRGRNSTADDDRSSTVHHSENGIGTGGANSNRPGERGATEHLVQHLYCEGVKLDLSNHVAYRTMPGDGGEEVPADPSVERHLFETRQSYNGFFVPAPPDELAHVVSHCVFDYDGRFSAYYQDRCDTLVEQVTASDERVAEFDRLLEAVFDTASETVSRLVIAGEYDSIRREL